MELQFLGTSSGVPTSQRNVSALALQPGSGRSWYLVDCGEATQHRLLYSTLSVVQLRAIFITHVHGDHCYGLPGLLASAAMNGRREALTLIGPQAVYDWLQATLQFTTLYLPYPLEFIAVETLSHWDDGPWRIQAHALSHRVPSYAYSFTETPPQKLDKAALQALQLPPGPLWGQLQKGETVQHGDKTLDGRAFLQPAHAPRKLVIGGDNDTPALLQAACAGAQLLVHEATYTEEIAQKVGPQVQHSSAAMVARFAEQIRLPQLILTHFSARYHNEPGLAALRAEAQQHYSGQLWLADDLARYQLGTDGSLQVLNS